MPLSADFTDCTDLKKAESLSSDGVMM